MNNINQYVWESGIDHAWIAEDKTGHLAYMSCCYEGGLPNNICIDRRLMAGLDLRINALFGIEIEDDGKPYYEHYASVGFYVYDVECSRNGEMMYVRLARPENPISSAKLPPQLKIVAKTFAVGNFEFSISSCLRTDNLFNNTGDYGYYMQGLNNAIGFVQNRRNQLVSVSQCINSRLPGIAERGLMDLHAVMGFLNTKNDIATIFDWNIYDEYFKVLIASLSHMRNVQVVRILDGDGCWHIHEDLSRTVKMFLNPPKKIVLENYSGSCIARLELLGLQTCAATAEQCRFSISCSKKTYKEIAEIIVSTARKMGH